MNCEQYEFAHGAYSQLIDLIIGSNERIQVQTIQLFKEYIYVLLQVCKFNVALAVCNHVLLTTSNVSRNIVLSLLYFKQVCLYFLG